MTDYAKLYAALSQDAKVVLRVTLMGPFTWGTGARPYDPDDRAMTEAITSGCLVTDGEHVWVAQECAPIVEANAEATRSGPRPLIELIMELPREDMRSIDLSELEHEHEQVAAHLDRVGQLYARARAEEMVAEANVKAVFGVATLSAPADLEARGVKATVAAIQAQANSSPQYLAAVAAHAQADLCKNDLHGLFKAIETKAKMLVGLGADQRQERGAW